MSPTIPSLISSPYRLKYDLQQPILKILQQHDLTLLDTCLFTCTNNVAVNLYDVTSLPKLNKIIPHLEQELAYIQWLLAEIIPHPSVKTIPAVIEEARYLQYHFQESHSFHQRLWNKNVKDSISGKFISSKHKKSTFHRPLRSIRQHNSQLETICSLLQKDTSFSALDYTPHSLNLLSQLHESCATLVNSISQYTDAIIPLEGIGKASITDCTLVGAALGASAKHHNPVYTVAILTKDYDIPYVLRHFLATDSAYPTLFSNVHIYLSSREQQDCAQKIIL